ncbi:MULTISPECIES: hypothetical protein [unclassified Knoellia]|uniref:channel accessory protein ArfC n=1 Tax=Knoellia altitudinis TaxID=3404795 RepID=UPI00360C2EEC
MSDVSWWLMLLSFVLGAVITWFWVVRRATRQVAPVVRREHHVVTPTTTARVHHGSAGSDAHGVTPAGRGIKGHRGSRRFHTEDSPEYRDTHAEEWFEDEESARRAGYTRWDERNR